MNKIKEEINKSEKYFMLMDRKSQYYKMPVLPKFNSINLMQSNHNPRKYLGILTNWFWSLYGEAKIQTNQINNIEGKRNKQRSDVTLTEDYKARN